MSKFKRKKIPTDLQILDEIYEQYYDLFESFSENHSQRSSKIYVPIDVELLAKKFNVDGDIIFGRLYYHLNKKHGYKKDDGSSVYLFARVAGKDKHCVNFPLVASVLIDLRRDNKKFWIATGIAIVSLIISIGSLIVSLLV